ncbi:MAG: type I-C CRISPR-associated protein Cas5 [Campylobacter sp.]|nr:type I-C CRISPR-associated protein Cas5 [Campylobacter sp.]
MNSFKIVVSGDFACFTRPELKVERVSYDVPTPSALEGLLKSIYWKPAIRYDIDEIVVFNPINFINIRRNEVKEKLSFNKVKSQMKSSDEDICIYTDEARNQRATMALKDVKYGIKFHINLTGLKSENEINSDIKHAEILRRRLEKGQCFRTPCFGCSEFVVKQINLVDEFDYSEISPEILNLGDVDLGFMLYGLKFKDCGKPLNNDWDNPIFSDSADAVYYRPRMINGIINVTRYKGDLKC